MEEKKQLNKQSQSVPSGSAEPQLRNNEAHEWHSRGYLPHRDRIGLLQSITFRLSDSLSQETLRVLKREGKARKETAEQSLWARMNAEERKKIEVWLDAGMGCCALGHPKMARVMEETFLKFDGGKYFLLAWCIMPNHVHVLVEPLIMLSRIVQSWKSYTGRWAVAHNAELGLRVPGNHFWMPDYWDRYIRNEKHLADVVAYIENNPVKAGLCRNSESWLWSSASYK